MGTGTFFSKLASVDPLAQALHLPGAGKYVQQQQSSDAGKSAAIGGPYSGVDPTLAASNAGYAANGPGANSSWRAWSPSPQGGALGFAQRVSAAAGQTTPNPAGGAWAPSSPGQVISTAQGSSPNSQAYVQAAQRASQRPVGAASPYQSY